jgi:hypothetical protein
VVTDPNLDTVFQSGTFNSNFEVHQIDPAFEPHYNMINQPSQVQLYEMVMGDVNNNVTTVLERADHMIKDNRIPPEGFFSSFSGYDTVMIVGDAENDPDFNKNNTIEGTGIDYVHFHIPVNGFTGAMNVYTAVYYQSVAPRFLDEMFAYNSDAIDTFRNMYLAADRTPVLIASNQLTTPVISSTSAQPTDHKLSLLNTLSHSGSVQIVNKGKLVIQSVTILGMDGTFHSLVPINSSELIIPVVLPSVDGMYLLEVKTKSGNFVFKVMRM